MVGHKRIFFVSVCVVLLAAVSGCSTKSRYRPPVEDRPSASARPSAVGDSREQVVKQPPGFENAGKAGYYTVKPGDTLIRVGLDNGQSYKDIARWNALEDPNKIEVGQVLRVVPPVSTEVAVAKPVAMPAVATTALPPVSSAAASHTPTASSAPNKPATSAKPPPPVAGAVASAPIAAPVVAQAKPAATPSEPATPASTPNNDDDLGWIWPTKGPVLANFEDPKNKGLDLGGTAGDPVVAAADGKVVYAGAGLRGYGNLVILKHNATYLSAYAHNQSLAVKEDQTVKKGQKIAEMGSSDAERVKLHFEVRRQGKPVDPAKYLPSR